MLISINFFIAEYDRAFVASCLWCFIQPFFPPRIYTGLCFRHCLEGVQLTSVQYFM